MSRLRGDSGGTGGCIRLPYSAAQQVAKLTKEEAAALQQLWPWQREACMGGEQSASDVVQATGLMSALAPATEQRKTPMLTQAEWVGKLSGTWLDEEGKAAAARRAQQLCDVAVAASVHDGDSGAQAQVQAIEAAFMDFCAGDRLQPGAQGSAGLGVTARYDMLHRKERPLTLLRGVAVHDFAGVRPGRYVPCVREQAAGLDASLFGPIAFINTACASAHANIRCKFHTRDGALIVSAQQTAPIQAGEPVLAAYDLRFTGGASCVRCTNKAIKQKDNGQGAAGVGGRAPTRVRMAYKTNEGKIYWVCGVTGATEWLQVPQAGGGDA